MPTSVSCLRWEDTIRGIPDIRNTIHTPRICGNVRKIGVEEREYIEKQSFAQRKCDLIAETMEEEWIAWDWACIAWICITFLSAVTSNHSTYFFTWKVFFCGVNNSRAKCDNSRCDTPLWWLNRQEHTRQHVRVNSSLLDYQIKLDYAINKEKQKADNSAQQHKFL